MPKYNITMTNETVWEFQVEADDFDSAYRMTFDLGRDELDEDEITDNVWKIYVEEVD